MKIKVNYFLLLFLFAVFCGSLLQGMIDPDLFWHLRGGSDILESGKIVQKDSWNYIYEGKEWVNQQWLTEIIFAFLYKIGGLSLVFYFKGFVCSLIALFVYLSVRKKNPIVSYLTTAIVVLVIGRYFLMRTQLFSFLFLSILLYLLEKVELRKRFFLLIFLFALWANIHAFFGLGLLTLGFYILGDILTQFIKTKRFSVFFSKDSLIQYSSAILSALATLSTPFGIKIYLTSHSLFSQKQETLVSEWLSVFKYPLASNMIFFIFFALLIFISILFVEKIKLYQVLIALPLIIFGFYSVRILPFSVIASSILFSSMLNELFNYLKVKEELSFKLEPIAITLLLAFSLTSLSFRILNPIYVGDTKYREDYPVGAVAFMKENNLKGKIFNEFDWGGYLSFSSKDFKTAIDGRTAVLLFDEEDLVKWRDTVDLKENWKQHLERGNPDFILLYSDDFLTNNLMQSNEWQLLYADSISALFGRKNQTQI